MDELTIEQVKEILGITYPTALSMARKYGRLDESVPPRGKWFVPAYVIKREIDHNMSVWEDSEQRFFYTMSALRSEIPAQTSPGGTAR